MPGIQELERFRNSFRTIGNEAEALARRGEAYKDFALPETGLDADLASLLETGHEPLATAETDAPTLSGDDFDFTDFLSSIPDEPALDEPVPEETTQETELGETEPAEEDFSIPGMLLEGFADDIEEPPAEEEFGDDAAQEAAQEAAFEAEAPPDEPVAATETSFDDFDFDLPSGFEVESSEPESQTDMALPEEDLEEELKEEPEDAEEPALATGGDEENFESFSLFSEDAPEAAEVPADEVGDFGAAASADDDFSMPEISLGEETGAAAPSIPAKLPPDNAEPAADDFGMDLLNEDDESPSALDSFDTFSLDDDFLSTGFGVDAGAKTEEGAGDDSFAHLEDFSLEGIDEVFRPSGTAPDSAERPQRRRAAPAMDSAGEVEEIALSDAELASLQETLSAYPLNLRLACEELIAEHAVPPEQMSALIKLLVKGASARETATLAGRLIGRQILIPRGFEKSSGAALEAEKGTFAYAFVHQILPVLRIFLFAGAVAASLTYLGIEFVYRPLRAGSLYSQGYQRIIAGDYARGNERFEEAGKIWRIKDWYFKYAQAFIDKRQYLLAEEKYDQLLRYYPRDKKGALAYAELESKTLRNFEKADRILRHELLDYNLDDKDGLLAQGDNNLEWGEIDPSRYEEARKAFARLMGIYGHQDPYLERMLLYFIRTDQLVETLPLQEYFLSSERRKIGASTLAELGGYLFDKKTAVPEGIPDPTVELIENIRELLFEATKRDPRNPEAYYHLGRYYQRYGRHPEEKAAIENAVRAFEAAPETSAKRTGFRIDALRRLAALQVLDKEFITAEENLNDGLDLYQDALKRRLLPRSPLFGRLYADLGDIEYFVAGDLDAAVGDYTEAAAHGWDPAEIRYRVGYAAYAREDWETAVEELADAAADMPLNRRVLFALGNAFFRRGDLYAAQGYYSRLLDLLETERARFPVLLPNDRPEQAELVERLMRARNNLGVVLEALADRSGDARLRSRALALYMESARAWDALARDPTSVVRSGSTNLAYLNTRGSLYPDRRFETQIYAEIDKDALEPSVWEDILTR